MRVLVGCEESGKVRNAFEKRGHDAWSNDLIAARNGGKHLQMCVTKAINSRSWDLIIMHPDCTALTVAGNSTYGTGLPKNAERQKAIKWTHDLFTLARNNCGGVALENPVGVLGVMGGDTSNIYSPLAIRAPGAKENMSMAEGIN